MPSHINRTPLRQRSNSDLKSNSYSVQLVSPEFDAGIDAARKVDEILLLLSDPEVDLWKLREFALSPGGLINGAFLFLFFSFQKIQEFVETRGFQ